MSVQGLDWLGVRTDRFAETVSFYRDLLGLEPFHADEASVRFRRREGSELHDFRGPDGNVYELSSGAGAR